MARLDICNKCKYYRFVWIFHICSCDYNPYKGDVYDCTAKEPTRHVLDPKFVEPENCPYHLEWMLERDGKQK